jgi:hypothetical protein
LFKDLAGWPAGNDIERQPLLNLEVKEPVGNQVKDVLRIGKLGNHLQMQPFRVIQPLPGKPGRGYAAEISRSSSVLASKRRGWVISIYGSNIIKR